MDERKVRVASCSLYIFNQGGECISPKEDFACMDRRSIVLSNIQSGKLLPQFKDQFPQSLDSITSFFNANATQMSI